MENKYRLTKNVRLRIYKEALIAYKKNISYNIFLGVCSSVMDALHNLDLFHGRNNPYFFMSKYKEIYSQKPNCTTNYWWPYEDTEIRIKVLENAIKELS